MVTPAEVCKIRMQAQSLQVIAAGDGGAGVPAGSSVKYRDVLQTATVVAREEGVRALYKGLAPTVLRQGCNQVSSKEYLLRYRPVLSLVDRIWSRWTRIGDYL